MYTTPSSTSSGAHACAPYAGVSMLRMAPVVVLVALVSGCGLKGDLYLPETNTPVVITPAGSSSSSSSSSTASQAAP